MIFPSFLTAGNQVAVVATAKKADPEDLHKGIQIIKEWDLEVQEGNCLFTSDCFFAGSDQQRLSDLQHMMDQPEIKAIFIARGGYGTSRIIDYIDFDKFLKHPKWICGFSDITALQLHLYNLNVSSIHGPMPAFFHTVDDESLLRLKNFMFGKIEPVRVAGNPFNRQGSAAGRIVGGNLSMICHTLCTKSEIKTKGNILFLEEVGESLYKTDRMLVQLKRSGKLEHLQGLIIGQFSDTDADDSFGKDICEMILEHTNDYSYPIAFNFPIGHTQLNYLVPVGSKAFLRVSDSDNLASLEFSIE